MIPALDVHSPTTLPNQTASIRRVSTLRRDRATLSRRFALMGESLIFETNDPALLAAAEDSFGQYPLPPDEAARPLIIRLLTLDGVSESPALPTAGLPRPIHHSHEHLFSMHLDARNTAVVDLRQGFAFGYITPEVRREAAYVRYHFIELMGLSMLSMPRHYLPIHAAGVVRDNRCVLLQARAGVGKTTLAYACARRGYRILAEDAVHVKMTPAGPICWGAPWKLHLLPDAPRFFPELEGIPARLQMNRELKLELDLEARFPGSTVPRALPGPLVLLDRLQPGEAKSRTGLESLSRAQALAEFEVLWPWETGWDADLEQTAHALLDQGVYRLRMNGSPDEAVDALGALFP